MTHKNFNNGTFVEKNYSGELIGSHKNFDEVKQSIMGKLFKFETFNVDNIIITIQYKEK